MLRFRRVVRSGLWRLDCAHGACSGLGSWTSTANKTDDPVKFLGCRCRCRWCCWSCPLVITRFGERTHLGRLSFEPPATSASRPTVMRACDQGRSAMSCADEKKRPYTCIGPIHRRSSPSAEWHSSIVVKYPTIPRAPQVWGAKKDNTESQARLNSAPGPSK